MLRSRHRYNNWSFANFFRLLICFGMIAQMFIPLAGLSVEAAPAPIDSDTIPSQLIRPIPNQLDSPLNLDLARGTAPFSAERLQQVGFPAINNTQKIAADSALLRLSTNQASSSQPTTWLHDPGAPAASKFSGAASYSYPLVAPPAKGIGPSLSLGYNSRSVDGRMYYGGSSGKYGEGWNLSGLGSIAYESAKVCDDRSKVCIEGDLRLSFNGTHKLIHNPHESCGANCERYIAEGMPQMRVERLRVQHGQGGNDIWKVYALDGSIYTFGQTDPARQNLNFVKGYSQQATFRWHLDRIQDGQGHVMAVVYEQHTSQSCHDAFEGHPPGCVAAHDGDVWPTAIYYNQNRNNPTGAGHWDARVVLNWQRESEVGTSGFPFFYRGAFLTGADMQVLVGSSWATVWDYVIDVNEYPCYAPNPAHAYSPHCPMGGQGYLTLKSIQKRETGSTAWPKTTFSYYGEGSESGQGTLATRNDAKVVGQYRYWTQDGGQCQYDPNKPWNGGCEINVRMPLLKVVENGYGGVYHFNYSAVRGPDIYVLNSHNVSEMRVWDGVVDQYDPNNLNGYTTKYVYQYPDNPCFAVQGACYWGHGEGSKIVVGYHAVWSEVWDKQKRLARSLDEFLVPGVADGGHKLQMGKPFRSTSFNGDSFYVSGRSEKQWALSNSPNTPCPSSGYPGVFVCLHSEEHRTYGHNIHYHNVYHNQSTPIASTRRSFDYNAALTGGQQFGVPTIIDTYTNIHTTAIHERREATSYHVNTNDWVLMPWLKQAREGSGLSHGVWSADATHMQIMLYDGSTQPSTQTVQRGSQLTRLSIVANLAPFNENQSGVHTLKTFDQTMAYNSKGLPISQTSYPSQGTVVFDGVNLQFRDASHRAPSTGNTTTLTYDTQQRLSQMIGPDGAVSIFSYGNSTIPWQITSTTAQFGSAADFLQTTTFDYDAFGRLETVNAPSALNSGQIDLRYQYENPSAGNNNHVVVNRIAYPDSTNDAIKGHEQSKYDGIGRILEQRKRNVRDEAHNRNVDIVTTFSYDALGRIVCESLPQTLSLGQQAALCNSLPNNQKTRVVYDDINTSQQVFAPNGLSTTTNSIKGNEGAWINLGVNDLVNQTHSEVKDANGNVERKTIQGQDRLGRTRAIAQYDDTLNVCGSNSEFHLTLYDYDKAGNLSKVRRGGMVACGDTRVLPSLPATLETNIRYNGLGQKVWMDDPDQGVWTYAYDETGNMIKQVDSNNAVTCAAYDKLGRLTNRWTSTNVNDSCTTPITNRANAHFVASYDYYGLDNYGFGQIKRLVYRPHLSADSGVSGTFEDNYTYAQFGQPATIRRTINDETFDVAYSNFDELGRPQTYKNARGEFVHTGFDSWGANSLRISGSSGNQDLIDNVLYNTRGQMHAMLRENGVNTTYSYSGVEDAFRVDSVNVVNHLGATLTSFSYEYDALGQITRRDSTLAGNIDTQGFSYDSMGRLTRAQGSAEGGFDNVYQYDGLSNLTRVQSNINSSLVTTYAPDANHPHAVGSMTDNGQTFAMRYDSRGNMTQRQTANGTFEQTFDELGQLTRVEKVGGKTTHFAYDVNGVRVLTVRETDNGLVHLYTPFGDYQKEVRVAPEPQQIAFTPSFSPFGSFMFGGAMAAPPALPEDEPVERVTYALDGASVALRVVDPMSASNSGIYFTHGDHLGSLSLMTDVYTGLTVQETATRYLPFGGYRGSGPSEQLRDLSERGFTGHQMNDDIGLVYMNARYYDATLRRFISADALIPDPADTMSWNRYSYVRNNPINFMDPSGHCRTDDSGERDAEDAHCWLVYDYLVEAYPDIYWDPAERYVATTRPRYTNLEGATVHSEGMVHGYDYVRCPAGVCHEEESQILIGPDNDNLSPLIRIYETIYETEHETNNPDCTAGSGCTPEITGTNVNITHRTSFVTLDRGGEDLYVFIGSLHAIQAGNIEQGVAILETLSSLAVTSAAALQGSTAGTINGINNTVRSAISLVQAANSVATLTADLRSNFNFAAGVAEYDLEGNLVQMPSSSPFITTRVSLVCTITFAGAESSVAYANYVAVTGCVTPYIH